MTATTSRPVVPRNAEPAWLAELRRAGAARFEALRLPTPRDEDWRFTDLAPIARAGFAPARAAGALTADDIAPFLFGHAEWPRLVFANGRYQPSLSRVTGLPAGAHLGPLAALLADAPELVEGTLGRLAAQPAAAALVGQNAAAFADGYALVLPAGAAVDTPIHVLFVTDGRTALGATHPRNVVILGANASASVVESFVALADGVALTNTVTEANLATGARFDHCKVQRESAEAFHLATLEVRQERDSYLNSFSFAVGAALSRTNIYTTLAGPGAHATLYGLYLGNGRQHVDHQTRIEHAAPNCTSWEVYKGILDGHAHGVFNGKVYVHPVAQKTDGKQTNKNLLLSATAKVDTKPQLEIFADDVKCTHGATVGSLDAVPLFYCRSRGIPEAEARTLLTYAFAADVLEEIRSRPVVDHLEDLMRAWLLEAGRRVSGSAAKATS
ncbi:MAG TPA: Fe-S cluster assembly protein SufD [Gemmatimonadales bacterium]|nr:Fe-S cluster assembly protein SufD [Gemmatimonadales bacterium]